VRPFTAPLNAGVRLPDEISVERLEEDMFHNLKCVVVIFLICNLIGLAQTAKSAIRVSGRVADPNEARVSGAAVTLKDLASQQMLTATTNEIGEFVFDAVKPGSYELSAEFVGAEKHTERFQIKEGTEKEFHITLGPHQCADPIKRLTEGEKARTHYCPVHRKRLRVDVVPIEYGLVVLSPEDTSKAFPNSSWVYYGGCVVDCYKKAEVLYCLDCRKGELKWRTKQGKQVGRRQPNKALQRRPRSAVLMNSRYAARGPAERRR
jgi:hypothetical protein